MIIIDLYNSRHIMTREDYLGPGSNLRFLKKNLENTNPAIFIYVDS